MCSGNGYIMPHSGDHPCDEKLSVPGWGGHSVGQLFTV